MHIDNKIRSQKTNADEKNIEDLSNDQDSIKLSKELKSFNPFEVLKITGTEIRHSNILAWLLDPEASHGLNKQFLINLIELIDSNFAQKWQPDDIGPILVLREYMNLDILIISITNKIILCIENKVHAKERNNQLDDYRKLLEENFTEEYSKLYVYLSKDGSLPTTDSSEEWKNVSYSDIMDALDDCELENLNDNVKNFLEYYKQSVRFLIIKKGKDEEETEKIDDYHDKLEQIISSSTEELRNICKDWVNDKNNSEIHPCEVGTENIIRFRTDNMDIIIPPSEKNTDGYWSENGPEKRRESNSFYYYELRCFCYKKEFIDISIVLTVDKKNKFDEIKIYEPLHRENNNNEMLYIKKTNMGLNNKDYFRIYESPHLPIPIKIISNDIKKNKEQINSLIREHLNICLKDIKNFEHDLSNLKNIELDN